MAATAGKIYGSGRSQPATRPWRDRIPTPACCVVVAFTAVPGLVRPGPVLEGHKLAGAAAAPLIEYLRLQRDHTVHAVACKELLGAGEVAVAIELKGDEVLKVGTTRVDHPAPQRLLLWQRDQVLGAAVVGPDRAGFPVQGDHALPRVH